VSDDGRQQAIEKMRADGASEVAVDTFAHYYDQLARGETGSVPESDIEPVEDVPDSEKLPDPGADADELMDRTIVLRLNGGLGTSMGMTRAKSLIEAKDGNSFLDVIARQILAQRERHDARLPLVLMNSFATRDDSLEALERYPGLSADLPPDFVQGRVPKIARDGLVPASWPDDPDLEWAPPGHGDIYTSLATSGMLAEMLDKGYEYAFVANSDNLGAVLDPRIVAWFAGNQLPFVMEVADRTEADKKGGHIARRREDGGLLLREVAQTPDEDVDAFQDTSRHRYFNTNNLWINLRALDEHLEERDGVLGLPMIVNSKTLDPGDSSSPAVYQLETAMGAAIGVFDGAAALRVPRERFAPVKTTNDLLTVRSDAYVLQDDGRVELAAERDRRVPVVDLDSDHFKLLRDFEARFEHGAPSLRACDRLTIKGDVAFGRDVVVRGEVRVENEGEEQLRIDDGAVLES
jgi:UTP--glucose-1-phosphate uridylyltransferase